MGVHLLHHHERQRALLLAGPSPSSGPHASAALGMVSREEATALLLRDVQERKSRVEGELIFSLYMLSDCMLVFPLRRPGILFDAAPRVDT